MKIHPAWLTVQVLAKMNSTSKDKYLNFVFSLPSDLLSAVKPNRKMEGKGTHYCSLYGLASVGGREQSGKECWVAL